MSAIGRIIETEACVAEGAAWLAAEEPRFAHALALTGPLPLRRRQGGFTQLLSAIVSQQVSVASANAIWARLEGAGMTDPDRIADASDEALRALGLSRQKASYARALAQAGIDFAALDGARVILIERTAYLGGTSAYSAATAWIRPAIDRP